MGLPIHRNSSAAQSPPKHDPTAHARSSIRRQPTIRPHATRRPEVIIHTVAEQSSPDSSRPDDRSTVRQVWEDATSASQLLHPTRSVPAISLDRATTSPSEPDPDANAFSWIADYAVSTEDVIGAPGTPPRPRSRRRPDPSDVEYRDPGWPSVDMPPLRRMTRRHPYTGSIIRRRRSRHHSARLPPAPEINGLGDRQRSWSPDSDHDQWNTLLTTITPDPSLPSASSSFAAASQPVQQNQENNTSTRSAEDLFVSTPRREAIAPSSLIIHERRELERRLRHVREHLLNHQEVLQSSQHPENHLPPRTTDTPATYSATPEPLLPALRINYNFTMQGPPDNRVPDDDGNCPFIPPARTLASPSITSDSDDVSSSVSGGNQHAANTTYSPISGYYRSGNQNSTYTLPPINVLTDHPHTMSNPERDRFRTQQAQRLLGLNETLLDFVVLANYIDRNRLPLPPNIDMSLVLQHLDLVESLLSGVAQRQREYLTNIGVSNPADRMPEEFFDSASTRPEARLTPRSTPGPSNSEGPGQGVSQGGSYE